MCVCVCVCVCACVCVCVCVSLCMDMYIRNAKKERFEFSGCMFYVLSMNFQYLCESQ